jgi:hypothetical protein
LVVVKIGPCAVVVVPVAVVGVAVDFYLISSAYINLKERTDVAQKVVDLVNTGLES